MKKVIFVMVFLFLLLGLGFLAKFYLDRDDQVVKPSFEVSTPSKTPALAIPEAIEDPTSSPEETEAYTLVSSYISEHISELSREKEVLGGKFYITKITFENIGNALVEYEDGHIALKAHVSFILDGGKNVEVTKWDMLPLK